MLAALSRSRSASAPMPSRGPIPTGSRPPSLEPVKRCEHLTGCDKGEDARGAVLEKTVQAFVGPKARSDFGLKRKKGPCGPKKKKGPKALDMRKRPA